MSRRTAGGPVEAGWEYERSVAEEVAKLQRLYGGGDLASFPEFTFPGDEGRMASPPSRPGHTDQIDQIDVLAEPLIINQI